MFFFLNIFTINKPQTWGAGENVRILYNKILLSNITRSAAIKAKQQANDFLSKWNGWPGSHVNI